MSELTSLQQSFVDMMTKSEEHARKGFELLVSRGGEALEKFFEPLAAKGLFDPDRNPGIVEADEPGYFRVPYWNALDYLAAIAKLSGEKNDLELAEKVMKVVRVVSQACQPAADMRGNYHTFRMFAEFFGSLPTSAVTIVDIDLIPGWLRSRFDKGMVAHALSQGPMARFLASENPDDWKKACLMLYHCTAVTWTEEPFLEDTHQNPIPVVDDYWLNDLLSAHSKSLGDRAPMDAVSILAGRVKEVFEGEGRKENSWIWRPAVEDHAQNHRSQDIENSLVEALRDVLLNWTENDPTRARDTVKTLLEHDTEIVRRIGIYILNCRWNEFPELHGILFDPRFFDSGHLHELYSLLNERFHEFDEDERKAVVDALRAIPIPSKGEQSERHQKYLQRTWLSAIGDGGYDPATEWFAELQADTELGPLSPFPSFHSYTHSGWGHGSTPHTAEELLAFAEDGTLIDRLHSFEATAVSFEAPTLEALVDTLEKAVAENPGRFIRILPSFRRADIPFQYGIIKGFKRAWNTPQDKRSKLDWDDAWTKLVEFFESMLSSTDVWTESEPQGRGMFPRREWIPPLIAEFLDDGTKNDDSAYPEDLLPSGWMIIRTLLANAMPVPEPGDDSMTRALNSSKGKAVEALFSHALHVCRISDKAGSTHADKWSEIRPVFEEELTKCTNTNYEFSTLAGCYLPQLHYMDANWTRLHMDGIFPPDFPANSDCAATGLAYANATREIYQLLKESGVIDRILPRDLEGRYAREKLMERIALAYLWGDEQLDSPRFQYLFSKRRTQDLEYAARFLWSVCGEKLSQEQVDRIFAYWEQCVGWSQSASDPQPLLSRLSRLAVYVKSIGQHELELLLAVAPHVRLGHNANYFLDELDRLAEGNAPEVAAVLDKVLETYRPDYDFHDSLTSIVKKLATADLRDEALRFAEQLRPHLPGMLQLYKEITSTS